MAKRLTLDLPRIAVMLLALGIALLGYQDAHAIIGAYDTDADGLIEISTMEQLDAVRYDLDGNSSPGNSSPDEANPDAEAAYSAAFPDDEPGAFCANGCIGYELTRSLDFQDADSYASNEVNAAWTDELAEGEGWLPIGAEKSPFTAIFEGNGHAIANLYIYIERPLKWNYIIDSEDYVGLFSTVGRSGIVRNVGLTDVDVDVTDGLSIGGLVGYNKGGKIANSYATGSVSGERYIGGLVGWNKAGEVVNSYTTGSIWGRSGNSGGLVGDNSGKISNSYTTSSVWGVDRIGGLVGYSNGKIIGSYWNTQTSSPHIGVGIGDSTGVEGKTTAELQSPTNSDGIYSDWGNIWDFGTASQYPALKADLDGDGIATWQEFGSQIRNAPAPGHFEPTAYDIDTDGLIEISTLEQLDAIRYDLDGDGSPDNLIDNDELPYAAAFPAADHQGGVCPGTCVGYELTRDLDFQDASSYAANEINPAWTDTGGTDTGGTDTGGLTEVKGWPSIASAYIHFTAIFEGNGHTIANLYIGRRYGGDYSTHIGLFSTIGHSSIVRNIGLTDVDVTAGYRVGGLVGSNDGGEIVSSYTIGSVSGGAEVGGLVGYNDGGEIASSYATSNVSVETYTVGGLVGYNDGEIDNSYSTSSVLGKGGNAGGLVGRNDGKIANSYSTSSVLGKDPIGGLVGYGDGEIIRSYWNTQTSSQQRGIGGRTTAELQTLTGNTGIYSNWDDAWDFGTSNQYPALKVDFDGDGIETWQEFGSQIRNAPAPGHLEPTAYDTDTDRLIEVSTLEQLNAIRYDLDGNGKSDVDAYAAAFPDADHQGDACHDICIGYELTSDLDFQDAASYAANEVNPAWAKDEGWLPIGAEFIPFTAIFEGNGHAIANLHIERHFDSDYANFVGLFSTVGRFGIVRNVGLSAVDVTAGFMVGGLAGYTIGEITNSYTTGAVSGSDQVGGLVGGNYGKIANSYANSSVLGEKGNAGGLVGENDFGEITSSYATGSVSGTRNVGGLVGENHDGKITSSYATGSVSGTRNVGGLVGFKGRGEIVGSYWDTETSGQQARAGRGYSTEGEGKTTAELQTPTDSSGIYTDWGAVWDFGDSSQYPTLKANFDGDSDAATQKLDSQLSATPAPEHLEPTAYDTDADGLIEISTLEQLNAVRYDSDGDGYPDGVLRGDDESIYAAAFPDGKPCSDRCIGYELARDLDFQEADSYAANEVNPAWTEGRGWLPTTSENYPFSAIFEGNGHTIANLYIDLHADRDYAIYIGLFTAVGRSGIVRNVGLTDVDIEATAGYVVGGLVGYNKGGKIVNSYATGVVSGERFIGGLIGWNREGEIVNSYATGAVPGELYVGGLVGYNEDKITNSYATGSVSGTRHVGGLVGSNDEGEIASSYAIGSVSGTRNVGGLVGFKGRGEIANSYWDTLTSGQQRGVGLGDSTGVESKTTAELQTPTDNTGIYSDWDDAWDFGDSSQYPTLKVDFDGDGIATWQEFGSQIRRAPDPEPLEPTAYDTDADGLIEISTLEQLDAVRYDSDGNGYPDGVLDDDESIYAAAFPDGKPCSDRCIGYELARDLDFQEADSYAANEVNPAWTEGRGWRPIGSKDGPFTAIFEGNGHAIANLYIERILEGVYADYIGLFSTIGHSSIVRNVGLTDVDVTAKYGVGELVSYNNAVGGLVGYNKGGKIASSYVTGSVSGESFVGGLAGDSRGVIVSCYATGIVSGNYSVGGLVGSSRDEIANSYAISRVSGKSNAGGLIGNNHGKTVNSYATGAVWGNPFVNGLVGAIYDGEFVSSYWDTQISGQQTGFGTGSSTGIEGKTTAELQTPTNSSGIYSDWDDAWDFGTSSQYPALKVDFDGDGIATWQEFGSQIRRAPDPEPLEPTAYDTDADRLIEISTLEQLNAIRYDSDGNGYPDGVLGDDDESIYAAAFPDDNPCAGRCRGYELARDLDFQDAASYAANEVNPAWTEGRGWPPTTSGDYPFSAIFEGNGHTIANLYIDLHADRDYAVYIGLFTAVGRSGIVRNVGLTDVDIEATAGYVVGGLVGYNKGGKIVNSYATGVVSGERFIGGLIGWNREGEIVNSYATGAVPGELYVGGLVGYNEDKISNSYASGSVSGTRHVGGLVGSNDEGEIASSYASGSVSGEYNIGGLVGYNDDGKIASSYWDTLTSGQQIGVGLGDSTGVESKTTAELQTPTDNTGIYSDWDDAWDFGDSSQYPTLKVDFHGDGIATRQEFDSQNGSAPASEHLEPTSYDTDADGLIEISTLEQLDAVRYDSDGDGYPDGVLGDDDESIYTAAFSNAAPGAFCANGCIGYELTRDLDFQDADSYAANEVSAAWTGGTAESEGWPPIGYRPIDYVPFVHEDYPFTAIFEGNGHTIANLHIDLPLIQPYGIYVGLFSTVGHSGIIRNVGLTDVDVTAEHRVGGLAGHIDRGEISNSYTTGAVVGDEFAGGLVGYNDRGEISNSYATSAVSGDRSIGGLVGYNSGKIASSYAAGSISGDGYVGGLVGEARGRTARDGEIVNSYATGSVSTGGYTAGGLVGYNEGGKIANSYATGNVSGSGNVGGLVGYKGEGKIASSYATGSVSGERYVGGLIGYNDEYKISSSYWDTQTSGQQSGVGHGDSTGAEGKTTAELQATTDNTGIYSDWGDAWDFGSSSQYPALKADLDSDGNATWQEFGNQIRGAPEPVAMTPTPTPTPIPAPTELAAEPTSTEDAATPTPEQIEDDGGGSCSSVRAISPAAAAGNILLLLAPLAMIGAGRKILRSRRYSGEI